MGKTQKEAGATAQGAEDGASPSGCRDGEEGMTHPQTLAGHHLHPQPLVDDKENA